MEWNGYAYEMWESTDERLQGKWFFRLYGKKEHPKDIEFLSVIGKLCGPFGSENEASLGLEVEINRAKAWDSPEVRKSEQDAIRSLKKIIKGGDAAKSDDGDESQWKACDVLWDAMRKAEMSEGLKESMKSLVRNLRKEIADE